MVLVSALTVSAPHSPLCYSTHSVMKPSWRRLNATLGNNLHLISLWFAFATENRLSVWIRGVVVGGAPRLKWKAQGGQLRGKRALTSAGMSGGGDTGRGVSSSVCWSVPDSSSYLISLHFSLAGC